LTMGMYYLKLYGKEVMDMLGTLYIEAAVVGIICLVFLLLFVVAGIRQILKDRE
jgi:hypothetical protein